MRDPDKIPTSLSDGFRDTIGKLREKGQSTDSEKTQHLTHIC
jgi:hypothetical protein